MNSRPSSRLAIAAFSMAVWLAVPVAAQQAVAAPEVEGSLSNLTRVETWRFFDPALPDVDPDYTFFANRSDLDLEVRGVHVDLAGGFSYVRLQHLPTDAIGPGGLGTGAFYFAASGLPYSYQVLLTSLRLSAHTTDRRRSFTIGRMAYTSGAEAEDKTIAASSLARVRRLAVDGRLVGTFAWSLYQRRFDGAQFQWRGDRRYGGGSLFFVTQGGYEESANLTMSKLFVGTGYAGQWHGAPPQDAGASGESQLFGALYRDRRAIDIRPDNAGVPVQAADITLGAIGASHVAVRPASRGEADYSVWGAAQFGDWYGQAHRAFAVTGQGGYRWTALPGRPWLRGGASYASGDGDGGDDRHGTFFPMLQETRSYAQSMVYAHANLRDLFAQIHTDPHTRVRLRAEIHGVALARAADRWYQGSGATVSEGTFFGYASRRSAGATGLGTVLEASADVRFSRYWSINGFAGRMWGGPVVRGSFAGDRLFYWYVENVLQLRLTRPPAGTTPP